MSETPDRAPAGRSTKPKTRRRVDPVCCSCGRLLTDGEPHTFAETEDGETLPLCYLCEMED